MTFNQRLTARGAALVQRLTGYHGDGKDVTDPRELYTILSQADTKRHQACISVPLLLTDATLQQKFNHEMNIRVKGYQPVKRPDTPIAHHQSSLELFDSAAAELPTLTLVRQSSSLEDLTTLKRKEKHSNALEKFPRIRQKRLKLSFEETTNKDSTEKGVSNGCEDSADIVLPKVPKVLEKTLPIAKPFVPPSPLSCEPELVDVDTDRQLVGVPNELVSRTKQILMEETFRERLRARGLGLNRNRSLFPRDSHKITDLKAYDLYPGQYWELRAESVHRPEDLELDMIDRDYYRMKQKSMLKLKVMDGEWKIKGERVPVDLPSPSPQKDIHRPVPRRCHPKQKASQSDTAGPEEESVGLSPVTKLMLGPVAVDPAGGGQHDTDSLTGPPNSRKTNRTKLPYILTDEPLVRNMHHYSKYTQVIATPRQKYVPPTSVVNLTINQETPRARQPKHIEQNIQKQKQTVRVTESAPTANTNSLLENEADARTSSDQRSHTVTEAASEPDLKSGTADDSRNKKSLLTGFKKLEVFSETKSRTKATSQALKEVGQTRYLPQCHPPLYKLDMRNYPPRGNMIETYFGLERNQESANPATTENHISLRVIDGGVILSKVSTTGDPRTSRSVKSEGTVGGHSSARDTPVLAKS